MGWRTIVALLFIVGGLGGYLVISDPKHEPPPADPNQMTKRLLPKGAWAAREIWFESRPGREPIILSLDPTNRRIYVTDPVRDVASMAVMESILNAYNGALLAPFYSAEDLAAEPRLLKETGLDQPVGRIEFRYSAQDVVAIAFGHPGIRKGEIWVQVGDAVYRTDPALHKLLDKLPDVMREHLLFTDLAVGNPQKVRFEKRVGKTRRVHRIEQVARGEFRVVEPLGVRADRSAVEGLLRGIGSLYVERFLSGAQQQFGHDEFDFQIALKGDKGAETLDVRILEDGLYFGHLRRRNINFVMVGRGLNALDEWLPKLRDRKFHHIAERAILRLELDPGRKGETAVFVRGVGQGFRVLRPIVIDQTNSTPMGELLHVLTTMEVSSFVDDPDVKTGLEDGADFFTIRVAAQREYGVNVAIRIGGPAGDGLVYARRADEPHVARIEAHAADVLRRPWTELVSLYVPKLNAPAFWCEAHVPGRTRPIVYVKRELAWREEGGQVEAKDVGDFVDALKTLRSKAVVPTASLPRDSRPVRVILRGDQQAQSGEIYRCSLLRQGGHVLVQVENYPGIAYRIEHRTGLFRRLLDDWLGR